MPHIFSTHHNHSHNPRAKCTGVTFKFQLKKMLFHHRNENEEIHEIVYIEYHDGIPHSVETLERYDDGHISNTWDFARDGGRTGGLYYFNSGSGGKIDLVFECPQFVEGVKGVAIWVRDDATLTNIVKGVRQLKHPRVLSNGLQGSKNPFTVANECFEFNYCKVCEADHADDYCKQHIYEDDNYQFRYIHDEELVE